MADGVHGLSAARSKGLFAGLSIEGAHLGTNSERIASYYGHGVTYQQLLFGGGPKTMPGEAETFRAGQPALWVALTGSTPGSQHFVARTQGWSRALSHRRSR